MRCRFRFAHTHASAAMLPVVALFALTALAAKHKPAEAPPVRATQPPTYTIPTGPLGYAPPGDYLGLRYSLASLDFLDEDRLLFTFRVPGLFHRDPSGTAGDTERHVRAVVVHIPDGAVLSEALWTLHDYGRYVYMLDGGLFALRDRDMLSIGDSSLQLKPWLHFPGPVLLVEFDPTRQYVVTESDEPASVQPKPGDVPNPPSAQAAISPIGDMTACCQRSGTILRIFRRSTGQIMLVSHVRTAVHVPMNGEGYLETLSSRGASWLVDFDPFTGGTSRAGTVESTCPLRLDFVASNEYVATTCGPSGMQWLVAMTLDGQRLWERPESSTAAWPLLTESQNGTRLVRETLQATHPINAIAPLNPDDITRQDVAILDAATGKEALRAQASPIYDVGGNVALSPSGRRAAILMEGGIEIFDLPDPPPLPAPKLDDSKARN
jgi:hypothetical protein